MLRGVVGAVARIPWWIWLILLLAVVPRLLLIPFGLPYELDPDERSFTDSALAMLQTGIGDPIKYSHPASPLLDAMAGGYAAWALTAPQAAGSDPVAWLSQAYLEDISPFLFIGRAVTAISGVGVVLLVYPVAREIRIAPLWSAVAALLMALSLPMIQFSATVRPDMLMAMFLLGVVWASLRALLRPSWKIFAVAGALLGLAAASKYSGAVGMAAIVAANATLTVERRITPRLGLIWLLVAACAGAVAAFVVGPFLFLHVDQTLAAIAQEARPSHPGATGSGLLRNLWAYLTEALPWGMGIVGALVGVLGLVLMLLRRRPRVVAVCFWALLLFTSTLSLWWLRWAIPLMPLAAVGAAYLCDRGQRRLATRLDAGWIKAAAVGVALVLLVPTAAATVVSLPAYATGDDTRLEANQWVLENVPSGSTVLIDSYSTQVSSEDYDLRVIYQDEILRWPEFMDAKRPIGFFGRMADQWFGSPDALIAAIEEADVDYIALSDTWIDIFRDEVDIYPEILPRYEAILERYPQVVRFDQTTSKLGSPVTILAGPGTE